MVLRLKTRESRSLPGLPSIWNQRAFETLFTSQNPFTFWAGPHGLVTRVLGDAGWSSPVARQAHNLKVAGSNPAPATKSNSKATGNSLSCWGFSFEPEN